MRLRDGSNVLKDSQVAIAAPMKPRLRGWTKAQHLNFLDLLSPNSLVFGILGVEGVLT